MNEAVDGLYLGTYTLPRIPVYEPLFLPVWQLAATELHVIGVTDSSLLISALAASWTCRLSWAEPDAAERWRTKSREHQETRLAVLGDSPWSMACYQVI